MKRDTSENQFDDREVREALLDLITDKEDDIVQMSEAEVDEYLSAQDINISHRKDELLARITQSCKQQRLQAARLQRLQAEERAAATKRDNYDLWDLRTLLAEMAKRARGVGGSPVLAHFRNYEHATEEDLRRMLRDWDLLDDAPPRLEADDSEA